MSSRGRNNILRIHNISDIHIGRSTTPASAIESAFGSYLRDYHKDISKSHIFIITGDYWDKLLTSISHDMQVGISMMITIMSYCQRHSIILRILEGTLSHDNHQCRMFNIVAKAYPGLDFKYIETVTIETLCGMSILYVPDDLTLHRQETNKLVDKALAEENLTQVDIAFMHTQFKHQLPELPGIDFSDDVYFSTVVKYLILAGHIHLYSRKGKITTPGGFVPLNHGEEKLKKGGLIADISENGKVKITRLYTRDVITYITLPVTPINHTEAKISGLNGIIHVRLTGTAVDLERYLQQYKERFPSVTFTTKKTDVNNRINPIKNSLREWDKFTPDYILGIIEKISHVDDTIKALSVDIFKEANHSVRPRSS